ncbi:UbiA family prenyltransferase (plasmid) [Roseobacteraceae bacterium NS-SX3]
MEHSPQGVRAQARFSDYIAIARPDHWTKNVFMLPGVALAFAIDPAARLQDLAWLPLAVLSTCLVASANYTINEYLDGQYDRHHPTKCKRPTAQGLIRPQLAALQYAVLAAGGLGLAALLTPVFLYASAALLVMGLIYNVEPLRSKDRMYLDVLSESINNPIRLVLGWAVVSTIVLPPSSALLSYWMGGAFLMAVKRYAEYRTIDDAERAGKYRRSFRFYTEDGLLLSAFFYALTSVLFLGIFLIKYKIEFILSFPFIALLFAYYLSISLRRGSAAMHPERLHSEPRFLAYTAFLAVLLTGLFFIDIEPIHYLMDHSVLKDMRLP